MRNTKKVFISILILMSFGLNGTIVEPENFSEELSKGIVTRSGSLVLIEEYTATWCQTCSEIDPSVEELSRIHNERVALVALHPADGIDDLGNYASGTRINSLFNGSVFVAPSFMIDRENLIEGAPDISALNSLILQSQSKKSDFSDIEFMVVKNANNLNFEVKLDKNSSGIINIMILENKLTANNYAGELDKFNNVMKELISINLSNHNIITPQNYIQHNVSENEEYLLINSTYNIQGGMNANNLGFIVTHEIQEDDSYKIKGVAKIIQGEIENENESNALVVLGIFLVLGIFASLGFLDTKTKIEEE